MSTVLQEKKALRASCKELRLSIPSEAKALADAAILHTVTAHSAFLDADLILCFFPVRGEVDLTPIAEIAKSHGISVAFPRCEGDEMRFHTVTDLKELILDRFGIPAPRADAPIASPTARTLCLLPGLAAGRDGTRLGYGGGFYDRFLAAEPHPTIALCYDFQLLDALPTEEHDIPVDAVLTAPV